MVESAPRREYERHYETHALALRYLWEEGPEGPSETLRSEDGPKGFGGVAVGGIVTESDGDGVELGSQSTCRLGRHGKRGREVHVSELDWRHGSAIWRDGE